MNNKRKLSNCGNRPRAFWGALIGGLISAGVGAYSQYKSAKAQADLQREQMEQQNRLMREANERNRAQQTAATLNNYASALDESEEEPYIQYKSGGRRKLRNAGQFVMTDGGPMINLSTGEQINPGQIIPPGTYKTLGVKHNQTNPQGKEGTGIIAPDGKPFEVEKGETQVVTNNEDIIFSNRLKKNGIPFSDIAAAGVNPYALEREQAKQRRHLRNGKSTPVERNRAAWGATFTTPDYIGLGTNIGASLLSNIYANKAYNDVLGDINYELPTFTEESYVAGPTKWNNSAQRGEVERTRLNARRSIARNTASSAVGLGRMQELDTNAMYELNKLWDEKANKEVELRQANAERQQGVRARNAAAKNAYYQKVADIKNQQLGTRLGIQQGKINSNVGMIQGIGSSIGGFLQQGIDNYQNNQAMLAQIAASPYGTAERLYNLGYKFDKDMMQSFKNDAASRLERYRNDFSDAGTKAYDDAVSSYNLWSNGLGSTDRAKSSKLRINLRTAPTTPIFRQDTSFLTRKPIIRV